MSILKNPLVKSVTGPMEHLTNLRGKARLRVIGDVLRSSVPDGLLSDRRTSGLLQFQIEAAREIQAIRLLGTMPDDGPAEARLTIHVDGVMTAQGTLQRGRFDVAAPLKIASGTAATIVVRTTAAIEGHDVGCVLESIHFEGDAAVSYRCNICDTQVGDIDRNTGSEGSLCPGCDSNIRLRAVARIVSEVLFGKTLPLSQFPKDRPIVALGISDAVPFAYCMRRALRGYQNTQFDPALVTSDSPNFDIKSPLPQFIAAADVVTCSEVLEHVEPPVQPAFDGLFALLKPGGSLVLTVPCGLGKTLEHFPALYEWRLEQRGAKRMLINRARDGQIQEFDNLVFHGGGDAVLEMRVFGMEDIVAHLAAAGFTDIRIHDESDLEHGIVYNHPWSLPVSARRPE